MKQRITSYSGIGGQAVLEGVMMRNSDKYAVAVRKTDGGIAVNVDSFQGNASGKKVRKIPFLRGIFVFVDSISLGMKAINASASYFDQEDPPAQGSEKKPNKKPPGKSDEVAATIITIISFVIAVAAFMLLPYFLASFFSSYVTNRGLLSVIEGLMRIAVFVVYVLLISLMSDIRRLYAYHGAEHKCINCIEGGKPLTVENAKGASRLHMRCGSSFMIFVMLVSVVLFFFIRSDSLIIRLLMRIVLIPVIAGISYELIYLAGRTDNIFIRILSAPGLWLQRITTREPDEKMIEVGIAAVEAVFDWRQYLKDAFGLEIPADAVEPEVQKEPETTEEPAAPLYQGVYGGPFEAVYNEGLAAPLPDEPVYPDETAEPEEMLRAAYNEEYAGPAELSKATDGVLHVEAAADEPSGLYEEQPEELPPEEAEDKTVKLPDGQQAEMPAEQAGMQYEEQAEELTEEQVMQQTIEQTLELSEEQVEPAVESAGEETGVEDSVEPALESAVEEAAVEEQVEQAVYEPDLQYEEQAGYEAGYEDQYGEQQAEQVSDGLEDGSAAEPQEEQSEEQSE